MLHSIALAEERILLLLRGRVSVVSSHEIDRDLAHQPGVDRLDLAIALDLLTANKLVKWVQQPDSNIFFLTPIGEHVAEILEARNNEPKRTD